MTALLDTCANEVYSIAYSIRYTNAQKFHGIWSDHANSSADTLWGCNGTKRSLVLTDKAQIAISDDNVFNL